MTAKRIDVFISDDEPTLADSKVWLDTSGSEPVFKVRNTAGTAWLTVGSDAAAIAALTAAVGTLASLTTTDKTSAVAGINEVAAAAAAAQADATTGIAAAAAAQALAANLETADAGYFRVGAIAPATPLIGMVWVDTTGGEVVTKVRNKANTAWLTVTVT